MPFLKDNLYFTKVEQETNMRSFYQCMLEIETLHFTTSVGGSSLFEVYFGHK